VLPGCYVRTQLDQLSSRSQVLVFAGETSFRIEVIRGKTFASQVFASIDFARVFGAMPELSREAIEWPFGNLFMALLSGRG